MHSKPHWPERSYDNPSTQMSLPLGSTELPTEPEIAERRQSLLIASTFMEEALAERENVAVYYMLIDAAIKELQKCKRYK